jgi:transposase
MKELEKDGRLGRAALRSGMDPKTARKYVRSGKLPSEMKQARTWRTREDPFEGDWPSIESLLESVPDVEAKVVLDHLIAKNPERYQEGQLRTLQRRFKSWRATDGPPKRVFFAQEHRPGEAMQTDFTCGNGLGVSIGGEPFPHLICHSVLPFSNWEWVSVCRSESMAAIRRGVQAALFELGRVPEFHQTDNSSAATHRLSSGKRGFNEEYLTFVEHFGMKARTTAVGEKEQNGDVEASNGVLKRRVDQLLKLRGSREFESVAEWESWLRDVARGANRGRRQKFEQEFGQMQPLGSSRVLEYSEETTRVSSRSTIRVKRNTYSVPSQLIGEQVRVRVFDDRLEVLYGGRLRLTVERLLGENGHRVNYRHVIDSLVRRPGAFLRFRYREDLFPSAIFRQGYDALTAALTERAADVEYLRILQLAARTMESEVEEALLLLMDGGEIPRSDQVKELVAPEKPRVPEMVAPVVEFHSYDELLTETVRGTGS